MTINEAALLEERAESDQWRLQITNARRVAKDQDPFASVEAMDEDSDSDEDEVAQNNAGADPVGPEERIRQGEENADPYLLESGKILMYLIELQNEQVTLALQQ